jgi:hypothetical protein
MPAVSAALAGAKIGSIIVNIDGDQQKVMQYYGGKQLGAPVIFDETDATMRAWNITSVPTVFYIGPDKQIAYNGLAVWSQVGQAIEKARGLPPGTMKFGVKGTSYG